MFLGDELGVGVDSADLDDREGHGLANHLGHGGLEALDVGAALADDLARTGAVDEDADLIGVALYLDVGDARVEEVLLQVLANLVVLDDEIADFVVPGVPAGVPVLYDADTQAVRINFLSHASTPPYSFSATTTVMWLVRLLMRYIRP